MQFRHWGLNLGNEGLLPDNGGLLVQDSSLLLENDLDQFGLGELLQLTSHGCGSWCSEGCEWAAVDCGVSIVQVIGKCKREGKLDPENMVGIPLRPNLTRITARVGEVSSYPPQVKGRRGRTVRSQPFSGDA
ncbi:MAG: hypothetical protein ACUVX8_07745 [Candidatus Zipacnadales bacterium]